MMEYPVVINGIRFTAFYREQTVEEIFLPLLRKLTEMQKEKGKRILVMLAAPPGAGTFAVTEFSASAVFRHSRAHSKSVIVLKTVRFIRPSSNRSYRYAKILS